MQPAVPGNPVVLKAAEYNAAVEAGEWFRTVRLGGASSQSLATIATGVVKLRNDSGGDLDAGAVLEIDGTPLDDPDKNVPWFLGVVRTGNDPFCAVLLEPIESGKFGSAVVSGIVFADVDIQDADNTHARVVPSSTQLKGDFGGWARIIYKPSGTGVKRCAVLVGGLDVMIRKAEATSTIAASSSGSANIWFAGASRGSVTVYYNWMTAGGDIGSGTKLFVRYFHDEDKWVVVGAECGA